MTSNKRVILDSFGSPSQVLRVDSVPIPDNLKDDQVLVRMKLRSVNPADVFSILGVYPGFNAPSFPAVPGLEGMGVIVKVGSKVVKYKVNDRIVPLLRKYVLQGQGCWQEYILIHQDDVIPVPTDVSDEAAAQFFVNPLSVIGLLKTLNVPKGEFLVQNAAGSTLGRQLISLAKHYGIKTVNIVRREEQVSEIESLGGDVVIASKDLTSPQLSELIIQKCGGKRPFAAVDCVAEDATLALTEAVRDNGHVVNFGLMSGLACKVSGLSVIFRGVKFYGFWLSIFLESVQDKSALYKETFDLMSKGVIAPYSGQKYTLDHVKEAIEAANSIGRKGKILLES